MSLNGEESLQNEGEYSTRKRLDSCAHGIQQLEALRLKHKLLMEQLRRDYPSMTSLIKSLGCDESDPIVTQNSPSDCSSAPSQISDDSGYDQNNSGSTGISELMDYNTFRKLSLEENPTVRKNTPSNSTITQHLPVRSNSSHIVEATLKSLTSQQVPTTSDYSYNSSTWSRLHKRRNHINSNVNRPKSCYGSTTNPHESESGRPISMMISRGATMLRDSKLLDSDIFAQITPPLLQKKFVAIQTTTKKLEDPPQIRIKQVPKRETPVLKILSGRAVRLQRGELILPQSSSLSTTSSPTLTPKLKPKQTPPTLAKRWQQTFGSLQQPKRIQQDLSVQCSNDVPRFSITTQPSSMSIVANAVRSLNSGRNDVQNYSKWKKNVASVALMQKTTTAYSNIINGSTTFPSTRKAYLTGPTSVKPQNLVQAQQEFTSTFSVSLGAASVRKAGEQPVVRICRPDEWHASEKL